MSLLSFMVLPSSIVVVTPDGVSSTFRDSHPHFAAIRDGIKRDGVKADIDALINPSKEITNKGLGRIVVEGGVLKFDGVEVHDALANHIVHMVKEGFDATPMVNFMIRLSENPSYRSVNQLFDFVQKNGITIDPDGFLLLYKGVTADYKDCHTRSIDNSIGQKPSMPRNRVDDDPQSACSSGYHAGAYDYVRDFGDHKMLVRVDPKNVVSVPRDASFQKVRMCEYEVIGEVDRDDFRKRRFYDGPVYSTAEPKDEGDVLALEEEDDDDENTFDGPDVDSYEVTVVALTDEGDLLEKKVIIEAESPEDARALALDEDQFPDTDIPIENQKVRAVVLL